MLAEELSKFVGKSSQIRIFEVEKGSIRRFAEAVGETNPLYRDEEHARASAYAGIIAPPGFFGWPARPAGGATLVDESYLELMAALTEQGYSRVLDGGIEYDFFAPVRAGDTLAASTVIKDIRERSGIAFVRTETTYVNQSGDTVATALQTVIHR